jgi:tetratricopeptide (TPR) repeat protein
MATVPGIVRTRGFRIGLLLLIGAGAAFLALRGYWNRPATATASPPPVPTEGLEPEVGQLLTGLRKKVEESPATAESWGNLGMAFRVHNRLAEAVLCFQEAERLDPANPRWPYHRGMCVFFTEPDETIRSLRHAVELAERSTPPDVSPHFQLGAVLVHEGRFEQAGPYVRLVAQHHPGFAPATYLAGVVRANTGDLAGSLELLERTTEDPTTRRKACEQIARIQFQLGRVAEAEDWNRKARNLPDDGPWTTAFDSEAARWDATRNARYAEARRLHSAGRYAEAAQRLDELIQRNDSARAYAHSLLGDCLARLGRGDEAEAAYQEAIRLEPGDARHHLRLGTVYLVQGEIREKVRRDGEGARGYYRKALVIVRDAVRIAPNLDDAQTTLGQVLLALGEPAEGIAALRTAVRLRPENGNAQFLLGQALARGGDPEAARPHLELAVRHAAPGDTRAAEALAALPPTPKP